MNHYELVNKVIRRSFILFFFVILAQHSVFAQIIAAEYFVDTDPGVGSATPIASPVDGIYDESIEEISLDISAGTFTDGMYTAYVRFQESSGRWGAPRGTIFTINSSPPLVYEIGAAEYFFNTDPGPGNGTAISTPIDGTFDSNSESVSVEISTAGLNVGLNVLYVRFQDANGRWSAAKGNVFKVSNEQEIVFEVTEAEYYIDSDPGEGNGTAFLTTTDGGFGEYLEEVSTDVNLNNLSEGLHTIYVRFKDANGRWSVPRGQPFIVSNQADVDFTLSAAEYFIDTDPGPGNGIALPAADGTFDEKMEDVDLDITLDNLDNGVHTLFTRFQKSNGNWGAKKGFTFRVDNSSDEDLIIQAAEYFINDDPGVGNGTQLVAPADGNFDEAIEELEATFNVDGLPLGRHFAFFRVQASNGRWGPARGVPFQVEDIVYIDQAEYFIDSDPGEGSGTPITVSADGNFDSDLESIDVDVDLSELGLEVGQHRVYVRFKNSKGEWSQPQSQLITLETRPTISLGADTLQFDDLVVGDSLTQEFTVSNLGDAELTISDITSSIPDFTISPTSGSIPANSSDELTFTVKYLPVSDGAKEGVITVINNDRNVTLRALSNAIPREPIMVLSESEIDFGTVLVGDSVAQSIAVYNTGFDVLELSNISVNDSEFRVSANKTSLVEGSTLTDSILVTVSIVPESAGSKTATLSLGGNVATQQVTLNGNAELNPEPTIAFNTDSLGFGSVEIETEKVLNLEIRNLGTNSLNVTTFTVNGSAFSGSITTPATIERGSPLVVPITYSPTSVSSSVGNIQIVSNDVSNSTLTIPLSGEGTLGPPEKLLSVNPDSLDFGLVTVNESVNKVLTLINSGNATLKITGIASDNSAFFIENGPSNTDPLFIASESSADVEISFSPSTGNSQLFTGQLAISSDRTESSAPLTVNTRGVGVDQPTPNIELSTNQLDFGELRIGESETSSFTITNSGNADLNVNDVFSNDSDFTILTPSNTTFLLQPGQSRDVLVEFEPADIRVYTNRVTISSIELDDANVDLLGSGVTLSTGVDSSATRSEEVVVQTGAAVPISITPTGLGDNGEVYVYYKQGGGGSLNSYTREAMISGTGGTYALSLPSSIASSSGISYWFEVSDGNEIVTSPEMNPNLNPYTISVSIPDGIVRSAPQPAGTAQNFYRLISVPLVETSSNVSTILGNFGEASADAWRLFRWQSGSYVEHTEAGFESFAPGRGYWFITSSVGSIQTGEGQTAPTDENFSIFLQPGWNMIGSPFTYETSWANATRAASTGELWAYDGSGFNPSNNLTPWEGYFVNNESNNPVELQLSPIEIGSGSTKENQSVSPFNTDEYWSIQLSATSGLINDTYNFVGVDPSAEEGSDDLDLKNAPNQPGEFLSLGFENDYHNSGKLAVDARPTVQDGQIWDVILSTNSSNETIDISASLEGVLPPDFKVVILDKDQETVWSVQDNFEIRSIRSAMGAELTRSFRVIVGTDEFIQNNDLGITDLPITFELRNNYPNPFNPSTTIVYGLPEHAFVTIEVFNTLGKKVATIVNSELNAGYHDVIWDASGVASGMYFYRMNARAINSSASFTRIQKMMLIK